MDVTLQRCIQLMNENKHFFPWIILYDNPSCAASVLERRGSFLLYLLSIVSKIIAILPVIPGSEKLNAAVLSLHYWLKICPGSHQVSLLEKCFMNFVYNITTRKWHSRTSNHSQIPWSLPKLFFAFFSGMDPCWDSAETQVQFPSGMCIHLRCHSSGNGLLLAVTVPVVLRTGCFPQQELSCTEVAFSLYHEEHTRGSNLVCCSLPVSPSRGGCLLTFVA